MTDDPKESEESEEYGDDDRDFEDDYSDEEFEDEFEEAMNNCGEMPSGGCTMIGTEYCDWECPFSKQMWANATKKRDSKGRYCK